MTDHLLAAAVDHLAAANWMFASVNSDEGGQPEPPEPVPRPEYRDGEEDEETDQAPRGTEPSGAGQGSPGGQAPSPGQLARFFG